MASIGAGWRGSQLAGIVLPSAVNGSEAGGIMSGVFMGGRIAPPETRPGSRGQLTGGRSEACWHKDVSARRGGHAAELPLT